MLPLGKALPECRRWGKSTRPDRDSSPGPLAYHASTLANWATEPHGRPATISPCLNRFVPESARNRAGTDETVPLLAARARTHTETPNATWEEKAYGPTGTRTQASRIPCEHSSQLSYSATRSTCDMRVAGRGREGHIVFCADQDGVGVGGPIRVH